MKEKIRYQHRVSWFESGEMKTKWFTSHVPAFEFYQIQVMKGVPVYYARKIQGMLSSQMFDNIKTDNGFGQALIKYEQQVAGD